MTNTPFLYEHQRQAIDRMFNGCILNGGVGSGKSRAGLYYYFSKHGGSMEPKYKVGDVLISRDVSPDKIKVGDTISYLGKSSNFYGKVITHQVVSIEKDENGKYVFHTKGLANLVEDPIVDESQVYGVVVYKSIMLSLVYKIVSTNIGFYLFIIVPIFYIIGSEIISTLLEKKEEEMKKR